MTGYFFDLFNKARKGRSDPKTSVFRLFGYIPLVPEDQFCLSKSLFSRMIETGSIGFSFGDRKVISNSWIK